MTGASLRDNNFDLLRLLFASAVFFWHTAVLTQAPALQVLGILVAGTAVALPCLGNAARFGDFSYGIYILHFPVIQSLLTLGLFAHAPWRGFWIAVVLVAALSFVSWRLVERPFLARRSHYRAAEFSRVKGT